ALRRRIGATDAAAATDRDHAAQRPRPRAHAPAVVARAYDPFAVLLADDETDVMRPHHDRADARARRRAPVRPVAREIVVRSRIAADLRTHVEAAPRHPIMRVTRVMSLTPDKSPDVMIAPRVRGGTGQSDQGDGQCNACHGQTFRGIPC